MKYLLLLLPLVLLANEAKVDKKKEEAIKKVLEQEKKFAKEQRFYKADEYDFKSQEVDPDTVDSIPYQEPEYDFDMSEGVYD